MPIKYSLIAAASRPTPFLQPGPTPSACRVRKGAAPANSGGLGASVSGEVSLTQGTVLDIVVGEQGGTGSTTDGGGGGGSFVYVTAALQPLAVAGGGGGGDVSHIRGGAGQNSTSGQAGFDPSNPEFGGSGGTGGFGGGGGTYIRGGNGGGGGGWLGGGGQGLYAVPGYGGDGPVLFTGGSSVWGAGGFGGGGSAGEFGGGGGGGYSGGGGGGGSTPYVEGGGGGGGGSYLDLSLTDTLDTAGVNSGNGEVTITAVVPEPGTLALLAAGALGLLGYGWRR